MVVVPPVGTTTGAGTITLTELEYGVDECVHVRLYVYVWSEVPVLAGSVIVLPAPEVALLPVQSEDVGVSDAVQDVTFWEVQESVAVPPSELGIVYGPEVPFTCRFTVGALGGTLTTTVDVYGALVPRALQVME